MAAWKLLIAAAGAIAFTIALFIDAFSHSSYVSDSAGILILLLILTAASTWATFFFERDGSRLLEGIFTVITLILGVITIYHFLVWVGHSDYCSHVMDDPKCH